MSPRVLITGTTGYIGGHVLGPLVKKHPEYQIVNFVRTEEQAAIIESAFPTVETVLGDLDNSRVLESEASKADVILNLASADHIAGALSLIKGISLGNNKNAALIHISGTGIMTDMSTGPGNTAPKVYNDMSPSDIHEILSFDESHIHRDVEAAVIAAAAQYNVKTAIISPPMIHGIGNGPVKRRSIQVPILIENILKRGKAFQILEGENIWNSIHIDDVAAAVITLLEETFKGLESKVAWLPEGYYFVEDAEFQWKDVSIAIAKVAHAKGLLKSDQVEKITVEEASAMHPWALILWGGNSRGSAERLRALGWKSSGKSFAEGLPDMIDAEVGEQEPGQQLTFAQK
ncbi:NAD(P)-binding protein [Setomelanomma holmii]|uniref:NAD(P)-binding protein n=1 Tax=Setomelanomma holmii TaxID=210430 RepID=A0A9P4LQG9_9PLEO|nr:NAD(P)-binding protein [Setomelanomma holmii]